MRSKLLMQSIISKKDSHQQKYQCLIDTCGSPQENFDYYSKGKALDKTLVDERKIAKPTSLINEVLDVSIYLHKAIFKVVQQVPNHQSEIVFSSDARYIYNLSFYLHIMTKHASLIDNFIFRRQVPSFEAFREIFSWAEPSLTSHQIHWMADLASQSFLFSQLLKLRNTKFDSIASIFHLYYPSYSFPVAASKLQNDLLRGSVNYFDAFAVRGKQDRLRIADDFTEPLNQSDLGLVVSRYRAFILDQAYLQGREKKKEVLGLSYNIRGEILYFKSSPMGYAYSSQLGSEENIISLKSRTHEITEGNLRAIFRRQNSRLRLQKARSYILEIKNIVKGLVKLQDPQLQNNFEIEIDSVNFEFIDDELNNQSNLVRWLETYLSNVKKELAEFKAMSLNQKVIYLVRNHSYLFFQKNKNQGHFEKDIKDFFYYQVFESLATGLLRYQNSALNDSSFTHFAGGKLSWSTIKYLDYGVGVISHEFGHVVSRILKAYQEKSEERGLAMKETSGLWNKRLCMGQWHSSPQAQKLNSEGEFLYTEEDWADYFSGQVVKELTKKYTWVKNMACFLNRPVDGQYSLALEYPEHTVDSQGRVLQHSTSFFRTLNFEKSMKGRVKKSCLPVVKRNLLFRCR